MSCEELRDFYELYALGVLEQPERDEIRAHLGRNCETCYAGVHGARRLTALLGTTAALAEPPARLRRRVLAAVGAPSSRWNWTPVWAAVAAGALLAAIFFNVRDRRTTAELARVQSDLTAQTRELLRLSEAFTILNEPEARQAVFGAGAPQPPRGRVFVDPKRGVLLLASNLPPAPSGKTYEMWIIPKGGKPVPAGLFQSAVDGTAMYLQPGPVDVAATGAIAVTLEPAGGVPQPTAMPPVIVAAL